MSSAAAAFGSAGIPACVHFLTMRTARNGCATGAAYRRSLLFCAPGAMNNQISPVDTPPASQPPGKWLNRTVLRTGLLAAAVPPSAYGRAFGFERMMDTLGAIVAPVTALWLLHVTENNYRQMFL